MKYKEYSFGLYGWENRDVAIAGGMRDNGFHPAGQERCRFQVYDVARALREGKPPETVADLVLVVNLGDGEGKPPSVDKIINVVVPKPLRRQGIGRRTVAALVEAAAGDLEVCDIKKGSKAFWVKMGAEGFNEKKGFLNATMKKRPAPEPEANGQPAALAHSA